MRGEEAPPGLTAPKGVGSPPRARGRAARVELEVPEVGITPACAGKSVPRVQVLAADRDHPRVRGEEHDGPMGAGQGRDHPRVRGEEASKNDPLVVVGGSPPRARGREAQHLAVPQHAGITPACAGKRRLPGPEGLRRRDHPRVRGEELKRTRRVGWGRGSPPRARGRDGIQEVGTRSFGITPACAGKRRTHWESCWQVQDHPRVRGEERSHDSCVLLELGSPPRARGRDGRRSERRPAAGITPACAGKRPLR